MGYWWRSRRRGSMGGNSPAVSRVGERAPRRRGMFRRWIFASISIATFAALIGGFAPAGAIAGAAGKADTAWSGTSPGVGPGDVAAPGGDCSSRARGLTTQTFSTNDSRFNPLAANQGWYSQYDNGL